MNNNLKSNQPRAGALQAESNLLSIREIMGSGRNSGLAGLVG